MKIVLILIAQTWCLQEAFSKNIVDPLGLSKIKVSEAFFTLGQVNRINNEKIDSCFSKRSHLNFFCMEGYYFREEVQVIKDKKLRSWNERNAGISLGVGMARALMNKDIDWKDPYQVDGWAFSKTISSNSFKRNLPFSCSDRRIEKINQRFCLWGAGRASYFQGDVEVDKNKIDPIFILGFKFASIFTEFDPNDMPPKKNIKEKSLEDFVVILKKYLRENKDENAPSWAKPCLMGDNHLLNCLNLKNNP